MARKRNVDDNIRDIDYYDHSGVQRANNPKVGMSRYDKVAEESANGLEKRNARSFLYLAHLSIFMKLLNH